MNTENKLLELRNEIKRNKPEFVRQELYTKKLEKKWRRPKGQRSKLRKKIRGKGAVVCVGYSSPKAAKGLSRDGSRFYFVYNLKDLENAKFEDMVVLSKSIGARKKLEILKKIKDKKLKLFNFKDLDSAIKDITDNFEARKKLKHEREKSKKASEKEIKEKAKPKEETKETEEDKKKREEVEKRKILEGKT